MERITWKYLTWEGTLPIKPYLNLSNMADIPQALFSHLVKDLIQIQILTLVNLNPGVGWYLNLPLLSIPWPCTKNHNTIEHIMI